MGRSLKTHPGSAVRPGSPSDKGSGSQSARGSASSPAVGVRPAEASKSRPSCNRTRVASWTLGSLAALTLSLAAMSGADPTGDAAVEVQTPAIALPDGVLIPNQPGPALRTGVVARDEGRFDEAAQVFAAVAEAFPLVADHAMRLEIDVLRQAGQTAAAGSRAVTFRAEHSASQLYPEVVELEGDLAAERGDSAAARRGWRRAQKRVAGRTARSKLEAKIAGSLEADGDFEGAATSYQKLWTQYAALPAAEGAKAALTRLEAKTRSRSFTARNWIRRGDALYRARHNETALAAFDHALSRGLRSQVHADVSKKRARTLFRLRRYREAVEAFTAMGKGREARFWRARSLARSGRISESIAAFEALAKGSTTPLALRSRYLAATLLQGEGGAARARAHFEAVAASRSSLRQAARWRLGWMAFVDGRYAEAGEQFRALVPVFEDPIDALRPRYWAARVAVLEGREDGAKELAEIAREFPFAYYGWRAAQRVDATHVPRELEGLEDGRNSKADSRRLARARILLEAGLAEAAVREAREAGRGGLTLEDRLTLAQVFTAASEFNRAQRTIVDAYSLRLAQGPVPGWESLWWYAWPRSFLSNRAFDDGLTELATRVPGELALAVMREESGYRPRVISPVGARGLMQIMPETGKQLASRVGREGFHPDQLFDAGTNIALGRHYLGELLEQFDGRLSAAIASYNAGPHVVRKWIDARGSWDDDQWVEAVPYLETRKYVMRVLRSLHVYRVLYEDSSHSLRDWRLAQSPPVP